jgi:glycosyltransferase involved in cell wall biosynthesis
MKPVLFVTGHAPPDRIGAFIGLHEREGIELALFGGRYQHGATALGTRSETRLPVPHRRVRQRDTGRLAASGRYRAVVCSTAGRVAPLATWAGARRARAPLILWASLWGHPRSPMQVLGYPALRRLYRRADAVVTYGPHVSAYVAARGAHNLHVAPQAVDNDFWSAAVNPSTPDPVWPSGAKARFLFAGRPAREKGSQTLIEAWARSGLRPPRAALALVGVGASASPERHAAPGRHASPERHALPGTRASPERHALPGTRASPERHALPGRHASPARDEADAASGVSCMDPVGPERLREIYASADVLVVPSLATATFREPWGLVINEAMNQRMAVICSDAVGAAAGGLVRAERNGVVVPAGDRSALADAMRRLAGDAGLRARLGATGAEDVKAYTYEAWAQGFSEALASVGLSRQHC